MLDEIHGLKCMILNPKTFTDIVLGAREKVGKGVNRAHWRQTGVSKQGLLLLRINQQAMLRHNSESVLVSIVQYTPHDMVLPRPS